MKLVKLYCPSCGANLSDEVQEEMKYMFCKYCGQKMLIDDEVKRSEHKEIKEDIAKIKKVESNKEIELRKLQEEERENKRSWNFVKWYFIVSGIMLLGLVGWGIWEGTKPSRMEMQGKVSAGYHGDYEGKDVVAMTTQLRHLGFTNIYTYDLNDAGWLWNKENTIASITINGNSSFTKSDYFDKSATITINYH